MNDKKIYELTLISGVDATEKKLKGMAEEVLAKVDGRLVDFVFQGKKDLVRPIKKQVTAAFGYFEVELPASKVLDFSNRLRMNDDIWRFLLVVVEKPVKLVKKAKKVVEAETKSETKVIKKKK